MLRLAVRAPSRATSSARSSSSRRRSAPAAAAAPPAAHRAPTGSPRGSARACSALSAPSPDSASERRTAAARPPRAGRGRGRCGRRAGARARARASRCAHPPPARRPCRASHNVCRCDSVSGPRRRAVGEDHAEPAAARRHRGARQRALHQQVVELLRQLGLDVLGHLDDAVLDERGTRQRDLLGGRRGALEQREVDAVGADGTDEPALVVVDEDDGAAHRGRAGRSPPPCASRTGPSGPASASDSSPAKRSSASTGAASGGSVTALNSSDAERAA